MTMIVDTENNLSFDLDALAALLGAGYKALPTAYPDSYHHSKREGRIITPTGATLTIKLGDWKHKGRLLVDSYATHDQHQRFEKAGGRSLGQENYQKVSEITVSASAKPERIAGEIRRRILPQAEKLHADIEALIASRKDETVMANIVVSQLSGALGANCSPMTVQNWHDWREARVDGSGLSFKVRDDGYVSSVSIRYDVKDADRHGLALAMAKAARDYFAAKRAPSLPGDASADDPSMIDLAAE